MDKLDEIVKIQCTDGNWNYNEYMRGMANGLLLAQAILKDTTPEYLECPEKYISDLNAPLIPVGA